jgi:hypothetical protein
VKHKAIAAILKRHCKSPFHPPIYSPETLSVSRRTSRLRNMIDRQSDISGVSF